MGFKIVYIALLFLIPGLSWGHGMVSNYGFLQGFMHPILGLDHLLAMVLVGILSTKFSKHFVWGLPCVFISSMVLGGFWGYGLFEVGVLQNFEVGIALSLVLLGLSLMTYATLPIGAVVLFVIFFGVVHGYAHGHEMPNAASVYLYTAGFLTTTVVLHVLGVLVGCILKHQKIIEYVGVVVTVVGFSFLVGIF